MKSLGNNRWTICWVVPLVVFLICRLFSGLPTVELASDQLAYLTLARRFPSYHLYDGYLFILHPPVYVYLIGLLRTLTSLPIAGLLVTQGAAVAVFFLIKKYAELHGLSPAAKMVALLYAAMLTISIAWDNQISRYSSMVAVIGAVLVGLEIYLQTQDVLYAKAKWKWAIGAILASLLAFLTTDEALALFPGVIICFVCSGRWRKWRGVAFLFVCMICAASIWPMVRLGIYTSHATYPAGIDGMIEPVGQFSWPEIFQPNLFPHTAANNAKFMGVSPSLKPVRWDRVVDQPLRLSVAFPKFWRWVLGILVIAALFRPRSWGITVRRVWYQLDEPIISIKILLLSLLLFWPAITGLYPWYGLPFMLPFAVLVGRGVDSLAIFIGNLKMSAVGVGILSIISLVFCVHWVLARPAGPFILPDFPPPGGKFLYTRPVVCPAAGLEKQLVSLGPAARFMAPVGLVHTLIYLTDRDVFALPFDPALLDREVADYHIQFLLIPQSLIHMHFGGPITRRFTSQEIARYVDSHQDKYSLISIFNQGGEESYRLYSAGN